MRTTCLLFLFSLFILSTAQAQDKSRFASLSGKAKTKAAEEEERAAESDAQFQELMSSGVEHFESAEYEAAITAFEKAEARRPLNVYPPVMIEDVRMAMSSPQQEKTSQESNGTDIKEQVVQEKKLSQEERVAEAYAKEMAKVNASTPDRPEPKKVVPEEKKEEPIRDAEGIIIEGAETVTETEKATVIEATVAPKATEELKNEVVEKKEVVSTETQTRPTRADVKTIKTSFPEGMTEETFKEGNKTILQRALTTGGTTVIYRKVTHGWGGVFYFKDGESISLSTWNDETEK